MLIALAKAYGAEDFIPISSAHVSGISYLNIGDAGVEVFEKFSKGKVSVPTTVNPMGFDPDAPRTLPKDGKKILEGQMRILKALERMGANVTLTCTPYYIIDVPRHSHVARAESSAVVYANSILEAYTNRESGISAMASALLGVTPYYGLHKPENRVPQIEFILDYKPSTRAERSALGIFIGKHKKTVVSVSEAPEDKDAFKLMGAASAASGRVAMIRVGVEAEEKVHVGKEEISEVIEELSSGEDPEFYYVGCPHASEKELREFYYKCKENRVISVAPQIYYKNIDLVRKIESKGARVIKGTCIVVSILRNRPFVTDSGKAARYCPKASLGNVLRKIREHTLLYPCISRVALFPFLLGLVCISLPAPSLPDKERVRADA